MSQNVVSLIVGLVVIAMGVLALIKIFRITGVVGFPIHKEHEFLLKLEKAGLDEKLMQEVIESKSNLAAKKMIDVVRSFLATGRLEHLLLIEDDIPIKTELFISDLLFSNEGPVRLSFHSNFSQRVLRQVPYKVKPFNGSLRRTRLTADISDSEILKELGNPRPFSVAEFAAITYDLLSRQQKGEGNNLLNDGMGNIFYVELQNGVILNLFVDWNAGWYVGAFDVDMKNKECWAQGTDIFSRSENISV